MEEQRERILHCLQENRERFLSGAALGESLNISRAAVWKQVQALRRQGYRIAARTRGGYRLEMEPDRLDGALLKANGIGYCAVLTSTNSTARELAEQGEACGTVIAAEEQLHGRGRRGRSWCSPAGTGLWFSILLRPAGLAPAAATPVTLVAAVALAGRLRAETGLPVTVKWPNDLLLNRKKLGGILTELKGEPDRVEYLVIGTGLNINHAAADFPPELRSLATSLYLESGRLFDRTALLLALRESLAQSCRRFFVEGFTPFRRSWLELNSTLGREVAVSWPGGTIRGEAMDLDPSGALLVRDAAGRQHRINYGEIT